MSNILRLVPEFVYNYFYSRKISEINEDCFIDNSYDKDDINIDNYMTFSNISENNTLFNI